MAHKRPVEVGAAAGERIEIASGVSAGDKVVVSGVDRLSGESATVHVME
jgi:multidrug efflux pump subunit AcrA (membrane-fusion protein)